MSSWCHRVVSSSGGLDASEKDTLSTVKHVSLAMTSQWIPAVVCVMPALPIHHWCGKIRGKQLHTSSTLSSHVKGCIYSIVHPLNMTGLFHVLRYVSVHALWAVYPNLLKYLFLTVPQLAPRFVSLSVFGDPHTVIFCPTSPPAPVVLHPAYCWNWC